MKTTIKTLLAATALAVAAGQADAFWYETNGTSDMDDSPWVYLETKSLNKIDGLGGYKEGWMGIGCHENSTRVVFQFAGNWSDSMYSSRGVSVEYRIGNHSMRSSSSWQKSANDEWVGLWRGRGIPFIKSLFGETKLVIRSPMVNRGWQKMTFDISGLQEKIVRLREACNW